MAREGSTTVSGTLCLTRVFVLFGSFSSGTAEMCSISSRSRFLLPFFFLDFLNDSDAFGGSGGSTAFCFPLAAKMSSISEFGMLADEKREQKMRGNEGGV